LFGAIDALPLKKNGTEATIAPVLFRLIYTCGLRPNEGRELLRENINFDTGEIYVANTKKKKDRIVVMSRDMLALCGKFKKRKLPDSEYFFPRSDGKCYTAAQIDRLFKKCWTDANRGIADLPNVRTYDLRHRFASARLSLWLDEGADLNNKLAYLRAYMGHKELSETAYYIHILPENLVKSAGVDWYALNAVLPEVEI
jgi:integrase